MPEELKNPNIIETEPVGPLFADLVVRTYQETLLELEATSSTDS